MKLPQLVLFMILLVGSNQIAEAQLLKNQKQFTRQDSLRGSITPERAWWDLKYYDLDVTVKPADKFIFGSNEITYEVLEPYQVLQIDLQEPMKIVNATQNNRELEVKQEGNAHFIQLVDPQIVGVTNRVKITFEGTPREAKNAPWDGGFIFSKDSDDKPFIGVAVQGTGASLWYPNKDHQSDEPESVDIKVSVPNGLMNVSNGRLIAETALEDGYTQWHWRVEHSINNYNITLNIADYVHFEDQYNELSLDYYVLKGNLDKAKQQFQQVHPMMDCFYEKFGDYPFQKDGFKLVETPYLGMEHQSAVAYGNGYQNGYLGTDLSKTGIGLKWDFIIIHESAHEWFGNSVSAADIADMWIHESFTAYAESVFVECEFGKKEAIRYLYGLRDIIANDRPIIGKYGVNHEGSGDMYYKGANMLNTLRSVIDNDEKWWSLLKEFHKTFKYQTIHANDVINFYNSRTELNLKPIFDQYLNYISIPELQLKFDKNKTLYLRWKTDVENFKMPIDFQNVEEGHLSRALIDKKWKKIEVELEDLGDLAINEYGYYITIIQVK